MKLGLFFFEILPLAGFFVGFHYAGLYAAAIASALLGGIVMGVGWYRYRRIARFPLFSLLLSSGLTAAALLLGADIFIKIQPTLFNGLFAIVLLGGIMMGRAMMKEFFGAQFSLTEATWHQLSFRWGLFFLVLALSNEYVWRHYSDSDWVTFKTILVAPASGLFMLAQLPLTLRGRIPHHNND
jgi:intracellular septation protein